MPNKGYKQSVEHIEKLRLTRIGRIPPNKSNLFKNCLTCGKQFYVKKCHFITQKFCSKECYSADMRKRVPWNKGKHGHCSVETINRLRISHLGQTPSISCFKKGMIPHNYKGGTITKEGGYIMKKVKNHPSNGKFGYIKNSRLVIEKHLGIILPREYIVHHKNRNTSDDRIENLIVFTSHSAHARFHSSPSKVKPREIFFRT